jgi:tripartite-type tricarboxylate transporter receptor subunit TctC
MPLRHGLMAGLFLLASLCAPPGMADGFPSKPIRVIVPNPPGGGFDLVGRLLGQELGEVLHTQVVVENRTGAGTVVGTDAAAHAPADGYTLLVGGVSNMAANRGLYRQLPYDAQADFTPLILAVSYAYALISRRDLPMDSLAQIISDARERPGKLTYASGGLGTGQHITMALLIKQTGVNILHVPYRGASPAYQDLLAGRVDLFFDNAGTARQYIESGQVKAFAVSSATRSPALPQLPTVMETGLALLESESWFGLFAPRATPPPVLNQLREALALAARAPNVVERLSANGGRLLHMSPDETEAFVRREAQRWFTSLRDAGVSAE